MKKNTYRVSGLNLVRKLLTLIRSGHSLSHIVKGDDYVTFRGDSTVEEAITSTFSNVEKTTTKDRQIRLSILLPVIICSLFLVIASMFVYDIEVYGYDKNVVSQLIGEKNYIGVFKSFVDTDEIENKLYHSLDLSIVDVRIVGAKLRITCKRELDEENILDITKNNPLLADSEGVISRVVVLSGTALVREGMVVKRGDVLIDTYRMIGDDRVSSEAVGAIYAKVYHTTRIVLTREVLVAVRTGRVEQKQCIEYGDVGAVPSCEYVYYEVEKRKVAIGDMLPLYLVVYDFYQTTYESRPNEKYDDYYDLLTIAYQQLEDESQEEMILDKWHVVTDIDDYRYIDVYLECERELCSNLG